ncbi:MAG: hypothetical protein HOO91_06490 [Bacteroidales bacterium]|nr:hypothetical protein [Bacteroidales bacterium]
METANSKTKLKKFFKYLLFGTSSLIVLIVVWKLIWISSGSNQWKLEKDKNGVKVYSLKTPGVSVKKFRATVNVKYSLSHLVALFIMDNSLENAKEWFPNCTDVKVIEPWNPTAHYETVLWKFDMIFPFSPRELITTTQVTQDKESKVVVVDVFAAPSKIPLNEGYVRAKEVHNRWKFTPHENGEVEMELLQDFSMGGLFPEFPMNLAGANGLYTMFHDQLPKLLNKEKYQNIKYDFIEELNKEVAIHE